MDSDEHQRKILTAPIAGWPEGKVRIITQNKSKASSGATLQRGFPLTTSSLKPFLADKLLPLLYPLLVCYGVIALGWPGVGKNSALITVILAMRRCSKKMLCQGGEEPSRSTTSDTKWPMFVKVSFSMIPTVRTCPWRTSNPACLSRKNKPHPAGTTTQTSLGIV